MTHDQLLLLLASMWMAEAAGEEIIFAEFADSKNVTGKDRAYMEAVHISVTAQVEGYW